ncbi:MAG: hypothetical protein QM270_07740 [Bacillota bacterium]|nr:hypothetical protein [Bacillota bacterium]
MSLVFAIEALKFYRVRAERLLRFLFAAVLLLNLLFALLPPGSQDFTALVAWSERLLSQPLAPAIGAAGPPALSVGNLIYLGASLFLSGLNWIASVAYASCYSAEREGLSAEQGLARFFRRLPRILALFGLLIVPTILSSFLLLLPLLFLLLAIALAPMLMVDDGLKLAAALETSIDRTRGKRGLIFLSFALLAVLVSGSRSLLGGLVGRLGAALPVTMAFVTTLQTLMNGRLLGLIHRFAIVYPIGMPARSTSPEDALTVIRNITGRGPGERDADYDDDD